MCARYTLAEPQRLAAAFPKYRLGRPASARYNIAPTDPVLATKNDRSDTIEPLQWGLVPAWARDARGGTRLINARSEGVAERPAFAHAFATKRALVWADGFYEWSGAKNRRQPHRFVVDDGRPFAFAGLWERWGPDSRPLDTVTILTTAPNAIVAPIHDRMPVVLDDADLERWLYTEDPAEAQGLLVPFDAARMRAYAVTSQVNRVGYDAPDAIDEIVTGEQGLPLFALQDHARADG
jgi:putative SOS response-associated peptidase YedK